MSVFDSVYNRRGFLAAFGGLCASAAGCRTLKAPPGFEENLKSIRKLKNCVSLAEDEKLQAELKKIFCDNKLTDLAAVAAAEKGKRLGSSEMNVLMTPEGFTLERLRKEGVVIFVNGIPLKGLCSVIECYRAVVPFYNRMFAGVINGAETCDDSDRKPRKAENVLLSVNNSIVGLANSKEGALLEPAVLRVARLIQEFSAIGIPIILVGHSQGTIIIRNALSMSQQYSPNWEDIRSNIRVDFFGGFTHLVPDGVDCNSFMFNKDPISNRRFLADGLKNFFWEDGLVSKSATVQEYVRTHCLEDYLDRFPEFYIAKTCNGKCDYAAGRALANSLIKDLKEYRYGEATILRTFGAAYVETSKPGMRAFASGFHETVTPNIVDGKIAGVELKFESPVKLLVP